MNRRQFLQRAAMVGGMSLVQPWRLLDAPVLLEPVQAATPKIILEQFGFSGRPNFETLFGWPRLPMFHRNTDPNAATNWPDPLRGLPNLAWYDVIAAHPSFTKPWLSVDHEQWPQSTQAERQATARKYAEVITKLKARLPSPATQKITFYGVQCTPARDYYRALTLPGHANYIQWQAENDDYAAVYPVFDFFLPSIYYFYTRAINGAFVTVENATTYFRENLNELKRCRLAHGGGTKPIMPYVWFRKQDNMADLDLDIWDAMCNYAWDNADGLAIFGGWGKVWATDAEPAPWWAHFKARFTGLSAPRNLSVE